VDQVWCEQYQTVHNTPDPQDTLAKVRDTAPRSPNPQETLTNISDPGHSTPDPQETLANINDTTVSLLFARISCGSGVL
jgi:hypothetical protein